MAGKIVADTLEHSTAGSVTTDYVVNGSAKAWLQMVSDQATLNDSLNVSSVADTATGRMKVAVTNAFNATTSTAGAATATETNSANGSSNTNRYGNIFRGDSTSELFFNTGQCSDGSANDVALATGIVMGDLA